MRLVTAAMAVMAASGFFPQTVGLNTSSGPEVTNGEAHRNALATWRRREHLPARSATAEGGPLSSAIAKQEPTARAAVAVERARICARVAEDNKGRDVVILDMRPITPLYDFFILITGMSRRQIHTIAEEIDDALRAEGETRDSIEGYEAGKWVVQDYGDIVVHVFDQDSRQYYALEDLWADAPRLPWA
jgi:ribosome-associated protein